MLALSQLRQFVGAELRDRPSPANHYAARARRGLDELIVRTWWGQEGAATECRPYNAGLDLR